MTLNKNYSKYDVYSNPVFDRLSDFVKQPCHMRDKSIGTYSPIIVLIIATRGWFRIEENTASLSIFADGDVVDVNIA